MLYHRTGVAPETHLKEMYVTELKQSINLTLRSRNRGSVLCYAKTSFWKNSCSILSPLC